MAQNHFGFEHDAPGPSLNHSRASVAADFAQVVEQAINGMLQDEPEVPAIAIIYLHEDAEDHFHTHTFCLASSPQALALLGYMGTEALDAKVAELLHQDEEE